MADRGSQAVALSARERRFDRRSSVLVVVVLLVPFVALLIWALTTRVWAVDDIGLMEVAVRDVGGSNTPLIGVFSRYRWHHPGPLLFYLLAIPYRLLGSDGSSLYAAAVVLNAVAVAASGWLLWRRGRLGGLLVGALVVAVLLRAVGHDFLVSPWNPPLTLFPMAVFVLAVWAVTCGDTWMMLVVVTAGSLVVQTHVGPLAAVVVGVLTAAVAIVVAARRDGRDVRRPAISSVGLAVLLWIPPAIDAIRHDGGNARSLLEFSTTAHDHLTGWSRAARIVTAQFAFDAPWITGHEQRNGFTAGLEPGWHAPVVAVALVVAIVLARRRQDTASVRLGLITIGLAVVSWISVARIVDEPYDYLVRWTFLVGAFAWLTIGWTIFGWLRARDGRRVLRWTGAVAFAVTFAIVVGVTATASDTLPASAGDERLFAALAPGLLRTAPHLEEPVVVESVPDMFSAGLAASVLAGLVDAGVDARYPPAFEWLVGPSHVVDTARAGAHLLVAFGDASVGLRTDPRYRVIAEFDGLRPRERTELARLHAQSGGLAAQVAWVRRHPRLARRAAELQRRAIRAVVVMARD